MSEKDNKRRLYDALSKDYDMGTFEQFSTDIQDDVKRKKLYDAISQEYELGDYDSFNKQLGVYVEYPEQASLSEDMEAFQSGVKSGWQPTDQEKKQKSAELSQITRKANQMINGSKERMKTLQEYRDNSPLGVGQTAEGAMQYNPESGKMEKTYITPTGNKYTNKAVADVESFNYRQAADMSVGGQLRKAYQRLADIDKRLNERGGVLLEEHDSHERNSGFAGVLSTMGRTVIADKMGGAGMSPEDSYEFQTDEEYQSLRLAKRQLEEEIQQLENYLEKEDNGERFWHDFGRNTWQKIADIDAWDFGKNSLRDASTKLLLADKVKRGEELTEAENDALYEMYVHDNVMQQFGDLGRGAKWGDITGGSLSFMKDFLITGGFGGISTKLATQLPSKIATKAAARLGIDAAESLGMKVAKDGLFATVRQGGKGVASRLLAEQGLLGTSKIMATRALGVGAEDLLIRSPLMVGTVQGQSTASEIINTKLGPVISDSETGELRFKDDSSWGEAAWEVGADKVIENFSEMSGAHLPGLSDVTRVFGARNLTAALLRTTRPGAGTVLSKTGEFLSRAGINGYFGEIGEEYNGQLWRTMLSLDSSKDSEGNNLFGSREFHEDIWGGIGMSIGLTGGVTMGVNYAGKVVGKMMDGARYVHLKHLLNKSDAKASELMTPDTWGEMRAIIDASDNADMCVLANQVVNDAALTEEQRGAVMEYMERSMIMRGHNLGEYVRRRNGDVPNAEDDELSQCYIDGYNISSAQEMNDAKNMLDYQRQQMINIVGANDGILNGDDINWLNELQNARNSGDEERANVISDYLNAKQVYDGMMQRVSDDIDASIYQSNAMVDARTNRTTGMIQPATMKVDDRRVYVIGGNLVQYADGSGIDHSASDGSIIIRDAETGALEQVSPDAILNIEEASNPSEIKQINADDIRQRMEQDANNKIYGVVSFNPGDTYTLTGENGQAQVQVQVVANEQGIVDNGDGTVNVSDGVNVFPIAKETIQQQVEEANLARLAQFEAQRKAENGEMKEEKNNFSPTPQLPEYQYNDKLALQDEDGNIINGIVEEVSGDRVYLAIENPSTGYWNTVEYNVDDLNSKVINISRNGQELWGKEENLIEERDKTEDELLSLQKEGEESYEQRKVDGIFREREAITTLTEAGNAGTGNRTTTQIGRSGRQKESLLGNVVRSSKRNQTWIEDVREITGDQIGFGQENEVYLSKDGKSVIKVNSFAYLSEDSEDFTDFINRIETHNELFPDVPLTILGYTENSDGKVSVVMSQPYIKAEREATDAEIDALLEDMGFYTDMSGDWTNGNIVIADVKPANVLIDKNGKLAFIDALVYDERKGGKMMRIPHIERKEIKDDNSAIERVPKDEHGNPLYESASVEDTIEDLYNNQGLEQEEADEYIQARIAGSQKRISKIEKRKPKINEDIVRYKADKAKWQSEIDAEQSQLLYWQNVASAVVEFQRKERARQQMESDLAERDNIRKVKDHQAQRAEERARNRGDYRKAMSSWEDAPTSFREYVAQALLSGNYSMMWDDRGMTRGLGRHTTGRKISGTSKTSRGDEFNGLRWLINNINGQSPEALADRLWNDYTGSYGEEMADGSPLDVLLDVVMSMPTPQMMWDYVKGEHDARIDAEQVASEELYSEVEIEAMERDAMYRESFGVSEEEYWAQESAWEDFIESRQMSAEELTEYDNFVAEQIIQELNERINTRVAENEQQGNHRTSERSVEILQGKRLDDNRGDAQVAGQSQEANGDSIESHGVASGERTGSQSEESEIGEISSAERTEMESRIVDWLSEDNLSRAAGKTREEIFDEFGNELMPIAYIPTQFISLVSPTLKDQRIYCGKGYFVDHALRNHAGAGVQVSIDEVDVSKYLNIQTVLDNPDHIKETYVDGKRTVVFIKKIGRFFAELTQVEENGKVVLHKSFFNQKKEPYAKLNDIRQEDTSSEGGISSISHTAEAAPAISLQSRGDVMSNDDNSSVSDGKDTTISPTTNELGEKNAVSSVQQQVEAAEAEVNTNPTDKQKEAGNYKKGHVQIGTFNVTIEQPKGSVRSGVDANGKKWETEMQNTYGYIRGTEGVDGDHIDVFLSDDIDGWDGHKVFVVDQRNADGSFDEHKVMLGFNDINDAEAAYMSNYEEGWQGLGAITGVAIEDFEKWIASSHRKTKAFAEYKTVKTTEGQSASAEETTKEHLFNLADWYEGDVVRDYHTKKLYRIKKHSRNGVTTIAELDAEGNEVGTITINAHNNRRYEIVDANHTPTISQETDQVSDQVSDAPYSIAPAQYTTKKGKVLDMHLVKFPYELRKSIAKVASSYAKEMKGWWDKSQGGFMMRNEEDAKRLAEYVVDAQSQDPVTLENVSMDDIKAVNNGDVLFTEPQQPKEQPNDDTYHPVWQYSIHVDADGYTTISRDDVSSGYPIGDARFRYSTDSPEEMLDILRNPLNGMQEALEAVGVTLENKIKTRELDRKIKEERRREYEALRTNGYNGYKIGDEVMYKGKKVKIHDLEEFGEHRPVLDTGLAPVMYEVAEWSDIAKVKTTDSPQKVDVERLFDTLNTKGEAKLSDHVEQQPATNPSGNRLVTDERYAELRERMRKKLGGQMNIGIDPEILAIGTEMAVYHLEKGARKFAEYATAMIADLGDAIRPYLKAFYNGARNLPEVESSEIATDMTPYDEVQSFDVANLDKPGIDAFATAETVTREAEVAQEVEVAQERIKKTRSVRKQSEKKAVSSQEQTGGLFDELFAETNKADAELHRQFAMTVKADMLAALDNGTKPYRSILDLRKRASDLGMEVDNDGRTDILLQELVEDGLVRAAREVIGRKGRNSRASYDLICKLYEMQPTIAARSSNRIKMQQYSTPLPMAWIANRFAMANKADGKVLEPTAGNGMLVFTVPVEQVHANELDETRLDNLREQGFAEVTQQDATEPFEGGMQYDVVIANPPFGKREAVEYDGKMIPGLDPQITLNALASMKDDGRAAIIIGGNMEYASNGAIKSMKPFFTYLYDHYNVKGVIDMSGGLYAKQGTTFPTRMILIEGRRSDEERAQTAVYPPVESKAIRKAESFDDLYEIINEVLNSKEKTNGTEILRSRERQLASVNNETSGNTNGAGHREQPRKNDDVGSRGNRTERNSGRGEQVLPRERRTNNADGETRTETSRNNAGGSRSVSDTNIQRVGTERVSTSGVGLTQTPTEHKKRTLTDEKSAYRPHNSAFSLNSVAPAAMVEAMDNVLTQIEAQHGSIDEFIRTELGYDTIEEAHQSLAAEQMDSVAMAIYQMKQGQALIIGDQTGVGKGRQMAALIRWAVQRGEKPVFITQKADLFSDIYRDLVDVGSGDLVPFIFNSDGAMVDSKGNTVHKPLSSAEMAKVFASGTLPDEYDFAVLTYSQVNTGDAISQQEMEEAAKKSGARTKKSKNVKNGKATPKATFLRAIAEDNYLFLDESHTAAGSSNTGAYLQSILRTAKAATFASATFAKRPDTMPLYAIRTAMSQAKVEPDKMISIIEKGGVTLQEIMSRELTNAGQMVRRERDMSDVVTDWKTITDPETVRRARENYDRTIAAFNAIIKFQEDYVKPMIEALDMELAVMAESAGVKRGTDKMGVENVPFASKTYNYTKQLMLALKVDAIADEVEAEINAGRHPVIALESTMESSIKDYAAGEIIDEPTFSASLLKGLDTVMQYTVKDEDGNERHERYSPQALGPAGEKAYYELQDFIRESTSDIFISPLDAIIERLHEKGYKVGELTGRNMYVERNEDGRVVVKRRTDKDKKRMQREFNSGVLDVLILNKSASTGISLHASEKFSDQRQRSMIIAQPLSDINDYMQMIGRIDRTGQVHRGYYINLGLPVPAENRFLMMLSTKLKSLNANTTTSQDSESNDVEAPDLLNKYGSQVVVEYLRDNVEIYEKMGTPLKKGGLGGGRVQASELDEYKPQEDDARKVTGYVALLTTKEQEEFYDDVVRRYNELIKYLNDTGSNDLKINVMPLRAKTIERRVSSEGIDPNGSNPFARNSFVEKVEMDVLRKPMKADEIRKVIEQINRGIAPAEYLKSVIETIRKEDEARIASEEERYEKAKAKAVEDIAKQTDKINGQKKRSEEEKRVAIENFIAETNEKVEAKHNDNILRLNQSSDQMMHRLRMFEVGKSYLVPDNLESMIFDFATPAIFCGYKTKDSKNTASTTLAVFATLDGRRRIEIKLSQIDALRSIDKMTNDNWDAARATTLDNWDSQIPSETRKTGFIMTGNILQAIADTQDEHGGYPGQLISYTDIDGNVHDGILMPDKWNASMLKTSGAPLSSRLQQIKDYVPITSHDGKVEIMGSSWAKMFYLTVPKTKKDGAVYYENKTLLRAAGGNFYPYRGKLRADIPEDRITEVVKELTKLGVKVKEERTDDDTLYRSDDAIKNRIEALFNQAISGEFKGKPISIGRLTDAGKAYLEQISGIAFRENVDFVLNPSDLMHIYKDHFGNNEKDKGQNIPLDIEDVRSLADVISSPDKIVFFKEGEGSNRNMFYFFKEAEDGTYNLMEIYSDRKGNLTAKTFYKTRKGSSQRVIDIEKSLLLTSETSLVHPLSDAKIPQMFESTSIEEDFSARDGVGTYTDDEVSFENDPWSKVMGKSIRTRRQRKEFAERERKRMAERVETLAKKLHLDNVEIVTDASTLEDKKQRAKGFYSKSTGKITIVIPNHTSAFDVEQTLLHEAVAHYGLRQLFGEHFDTFLDNVFNNADESIRKRIVALAAKNGWDFRKATEEYLAMLAENTQFEEAYRTGWWQQIKDFFLNMLHKIGFEDFRGVTLTDNELRYILWRSYENLAEPGRHRSILGEAADVAMQYDLKVGNYSVTNLNPNRAAENDDELYRDGSTLRQEYDKKVRIPNKSGSVKWNENLPYRMKESYQDSMASLKTLQDLISEETGNPIQSHENAYMAENRMSSENKAQAEIYERDFYNPLRKAVQALIKAGSSYDDLKSYIIAKHGLERNEYMRTQAEQNGEDSNRDFAGLTALTGMDNVADAEAEAQRMVDEYEDDFDVSDLWKKINAATKETLRKSYDSGLMDKATYEKVRDMYEYYVPLRGWDCEVASNEYEYLTANRLMLSPALKVAKGRTSLADDPLATIGFMAESSIVQGNRNRMKQKFLNFVLNNPTDLVSVSEQWYVLDNATGEWEARNPVIPDNATGDEVAAIVEQFEQEMEALGDKATKKRNGLKLSMNITKREGQEHVVRVKRNGKEYCLYINGSPRAAQAINGLTNPDANDGSLYKAAKALKHWMASMFTSKNPAFIATNLSRDVIWAGTAVAIKEDAAYTARYTKNISECLLKAQLPRLLVKYKNGTLDMNNDLERYFDEFIRNGGETGFTQLNTVEDYKRNIKRFVKEAQGKGSITNKAWNGLWNSVEFLNRSAEDTTRFMVYMTSRQMGRDMARSIYDAKEITVNFNKKGSGGLGASVMNFSYIFFNATIQSLSNFGKLLAKHPVKTTMALTLFSSAGLLVPMLNLAIQAMLGGDDDDENSYWDLPEWVRRNNIVLYVPWSENGYITIPLPHEMRPFYGMGEIAYSCLMNKEDVENGLMKAAAGFSALLPIDLTGNGGNIAVNMTPTIGQPFAQIIANTDYFGKPIYKRHEWNERYPEWTKAYKGTAPWLVDGTRWLNDITGGDNVKSGAIDLNPALIEHIFESYFGGVGKTINKSQKTLEMLWNEDLREWRNVPVVSSFYQTAEERTAGSQINREYFNAVDEMKDTQHLYSGYKREVKMGNIEYAEKINELINSEVFKRYGLIKGYSNAIEKATNALKLIEDPTKREDVETTIMNLKVEMLEKLGDLEERK